MGLDMHLACKQFVKRLDEEILRRSTRRMPQPLIFKVFHDFGQHVSPPLAKNSRIRCWLLTMSFLSPSQLCHLLLLERSGFFWARNHHFQVLKMRKSRVRHPAFWDNTPEPLFEQRFRP